MKNNCLFLIINLLFIITNSEFLRIDNNIDFAKVEIDEPLKKIEELKNRNFLEEYYEEQLIDHFRYTSDKTYSMRYLVNDTFWDKKNNGEYIFSTYLKIKDSKKKKKNYFII